VSWHLTSLRDARLTVSRSACEESSIDCATRNQLFGGRIVGTVTANSAEFGGEVPFPTPADLGNILRLRTGFLAPVSMIDVGAQALKCAQGQQVVQHDDES